MVTRRFVAMIDILGFRRMVQTLPAEDVVRRVEKLFKHIPKLDIAWGVGGGNIQEESGITKTAHAQFSDTILLWTPPIDSCSIYRQDFELQGLLFATTGAIFHGFLNGLPLRAGVAFGECYINKRTQTYVGQAIVDAYSTERQQDWIGGALHPSCDGRVAHRTDFKNVVMPYSVPVKPGSTIAITYALNWPETAHSSVLVNRRKYGVSVRNLLRQALQEHLASEIPESVNLKYKNTAAFIEDSLRSGVLYWLNSARRFRRRQRQLRARKARARKAR